MQTNFFKAFGQSPEAFSNALYALCDYETLLKKKLDMEAFIHIIQNNNTKLVQYRNKISSHKMQKEHLKLLKSKLNIPVIINDNVSLIDYADGLHLGQEDLTAVHQDKQMAVKLLRKKIGHKLLGLSTHNEIEILQANELDLDMIGLGAYKNTSTKDVDTVLGDKLSYLARISKHPVCAIGGVSMDDSIEHVTFNVVGSGLYEIKKECF